MKTINLVLLSASVFFIDTLPVATHRVFARVGLTVVITVAGVTYIWLKIHTADLFSKYSPPEWRDDAGFVILSTFQICCNFLLFQVRCACISAHAGGHMILSECACRL